MFNVSPGRYCLNPRMASAMRGFTLTEILFILMLVGILVAIALPKFFDATSNADQANVNSVAEALNTASAKNYSLSLSGSPNAFAVTNCTSVVQGLPAGHSLPVGYTVSSIAVTQHARVTCTVSDGSHTASFVAVGT